MDCVFFLFYLFLPLGDKVGLSSSELVKEEPKDPLKIFCLSCTDCENLPFSITLLDGGVEVSETSVCTPYMVSKSGRGFFFYFRKRKRMKNHGTSKLKVICNSNIKKSK